MVSITLKLVRYKREDTETVSIIDNHYPMTLCLVAQPVIDEPQDIRIRPIPAGNLSLFGDLPVAFLEPYYMACMYPEHPGITRFVSRSVLVFDGKLRFPFGLLSSYSLRRPRACYLPNSPKVNWCGSARRLLNLALYFGKDVAIDKMWITPERDNGGRSGMRYSLICEKPDQNVDIPSSLREDYTCQSSWWGRYGGVVCWRLSIATHNRCYFLHLSLIL